MKSRALSVLVLVAMSGVLLAQPPKVKIDNEVRPNGQYVRFTPDTDAVSVTYIGLDGVDAFPNEELKDSRRFLLDIRGLEQNRSYRFAAVASSKTGEQTRVDFLVVIGIPQPLPTPPGPKPPPSPTPPAPVDPLVKALQDVFQGEQGEQKGKLPQLVEAMTYAVEQAKTAATNSDLASLLRVKTKEVLGDTATVSHLYNTRKAIGDYLNKELPYGPITFDDVTRAKYVAAYTKVRDALKEVK